MPNSLALKVEKDVKNKKHSCDYTDAMEQYYQFLVNDKEYKPAKIYQDKFQKEIIEACLLGGSPIDEISSLFKIKEEYLVDYNALFFNMSHFETHLDKIGYVYSYPDGFGKELKLRALSIGSEFVYFRYANIIPKTESQRNMVKKMFLASAYKAMEMNYNPMSSDVSKLSLEYGKLMLKAYECIEKLMKDDSQFDVALSKMIMAKETELSKALKLEGDII